MKDSAPCLYQVAEEVPHGEDVTDLVAEMRRLMLMGDHRGAGIGLAANQVGVCKRVITLAVGGFHKNIINPIITKTLGGKVNSREGCLSFPAIGDVLRVRHRQIIVEGFNEQWQPVRYKLRSLAAKAVQHEIDHLDGITITKKQEN